MLQQLPGRPARRRPSPRPSNSPARARAAVHFALEAFAVDGQAALAGHLLLLIERQAVGVVELEGDRAGTGRHP